MMRGVVAMLGFVAGCGFRPAPAPAHDDADLGDAAVVTVPLTAWEISADGTTWAPTTLPSTNWGCSNCTRYFRTVVTGMPRVVDFEWSSDNRARMTVNGKSAFAAYWLPNYCTDATCCGKCCDTTANCLANISTPQSLDGVALALFTPGSNTIEWEIGQEGGGSGFYVVMTMRY